MSKQRSLEQERAKAAWKNVADAEKQKYAGKYGQLAQSAPATIQLNGLGQTLAFWTAKGEAHQVALLKDVSAWVKSEMNLQTDDLLEWVVNQAKTDEYRRATVIALAFLAWLKRFAEAELGDKSAQTQETAP